MYTGPNISDTGLILCLDAANVKSYVNGSTSWNDLSRNGYNGTLTNGPTFNSANLGSIVFDGVDDYIALGNPVVTSQITAETFIKIDTSNILLNVVASYILGRENSFRLLAFTSSFGWVCATNNNSWYSTGTAIDYPTPMNNVWNHVVGTYDGTKNNLYINGNLVVTGSFISGDLRGANDNFGLMNTHNSAQPAVTYAKGSASVFRIYNRALSPEEVLLNYEGLKSRYGL